MPAHRLLGDDWLRLRTGELADHLRRDHAQPRSRSSVTELLAAHYAAHRPQGSRAHPFFPGERCPRPSRTRQHEDFQRFGLVDPDRRRRQLEDAFVRLNPDFGVVPEHGNRGQHDLAWRREQAMILGLRVLVELRNENTGPPATRHNIIIRRAAPERTRALDRAGEVER